MKKTFLSVLFTVVLISSFTATAFAADQQTKGSTATHVNLAVVPLNHGVDY